MEPQPGEITIRVRNSKKFVCFGMVDVFNVPERNHRTNQALTQLKKAIDYEDLVRPQRSKPYKIRIK